jgi:L-histidine Nalpha-methyltransferase
MNTNSSSSALVWEDSETGVQRLRDEVLSGLSAAPKTLPSKLHFDERGSMLFDCLCTLPEFYPARAEMKILEHYAIEITEVLGLDSTLVLKELTRRQRAMEILGSREERPSRLTLREYLWSAKGWSEATIHQRLRTVSGQSRSSAGTHGPRKILYLPWFVVGSLSPAEMEQTLAAAGKLCGGNGGILLGIDLTRDLRALEQVYNDRLGIAAAFNLNILERLNRELDADFNLRWFQHRAFHDAAHGVTEMQLVSLRDQKACLDGLSIFFREYETIQTARYYLHSLPDFSRRAEASRLRVEYVWTDERETFSVQCLKPDCSWQVENKGH